MLELHHLTALDATARALIHAMFLEMSARYPELTGDPSQSFSDSDLASSRATFVVATVNNQPVGCGALRPLSATQGEIKRMFVHTDWRGQGIARAILTELEQTARQHAYHDLILETGLRQPEAMALYERCGWQRIPSYGEYADDPLSVCYGKHITP